MKRALIDAVCAVACLAAVWVGAAVALDGCWEATHGGGSASGTVAGAGFLLALAGAAARRMLAEVRRG